MTIGFHDVVSFLQTLTPEMALVGLLVGLAVMAIFLQGGGQR